MPRGDAFGGDALQRLGAPLSAGVSPRAKAEEVAFAVSVVASQCRLQGEVLLLWGKLKVLVQRLRRMYFLEAWATSLELCSDTLARLGHVRVHAHAFIFGRSAFALSAPRKLSF